MIMNWLKALMGGAAPDLEISEKAIFLNRIHGLENPKILGKEDMALYSIHVGCPVCLVSPMKFLVGPSSSGGENVFCKDCGTRFVAYFIPGCPMLHIVRERELSKEELEK